MGVGVGAGRPDGEQADAKDTVMTTASHSRLPRRRSLMLFFDISPSDNKTPGIRRSDRPEERGLPIDATGWALPAPRGVPSRIDVTAAGFGAGPGAAGDDTAEGGRSTDS